MHKHRPERLEAAELSRMPFFFMPLPQKSHTIQIRLEAASPTKVDFCLNMSQCGVCLLRISKKKTENCPFNFWSHFPWSGWSGSSAFTWTSKVTKYRVMNNFWGHVATGRCLTLVHAFWWHLQSDIPWPSEWVCLLPWNVVCLSQLLLVCLNSS